MSIPERASRLKQAESAYRHLLERQAAAPGSPARLEEEALSTAYQLGRQLLASGASLLEVAQLHHHVLAGWVDAVDAQRQIEMAGQLYRELLAGYEMLLRGYSDANTALRNLNGRMEQQVERIARALHDESGQLLAAVMIRLDQARAASPASCAAELAAVRRLLDQVEVQLRRLAHELHPALLTDLGLRPALEFLADGVAARSGLVINLDGGLAQRPPAAIELCLYRCVQECLNNVVRHAQAHQVRIQILAGERGLEIRVGDDGRGFAPAALPTPGQPRGLGLAGIRERLRAVGGELQIQTLPGAGTELRLQVPADRKGWLYASSAAVGG